jgi:hypothetical protein
MCGKSKGLDYSSCVDKLHKHDMVELINSNPQATPPAAPASAPVQTVHIDVDLNAPDAEQQLERLLAAAKPTDEAVRETDKKSMAGDDKNTGADKKKGSDEDDEAGDPLSPHHPPDGDSLHKQLPVNTSHEKIAAAGHVTKGGDGVASGAAAGGKHELPAAFIGCGSRVSGSQELEIFRLTSAERQELVRGLRLKLSIGENEAAALLREHQVESLILSLAADIKDAKSPQRQESVIRSIKAHPLCIALICGPALILKSQLHNDVSHTVHILGH